MRSERVLGVVPVVDRDRGPAQVRAQARALRLAAVNTCVPIGLSKKVADRDRKSMVASNTSPPSGDR